MVKYLSTVKIQFWSKSQQQRYNVKQTSNIITEHFLAFIFTYEDGCKTLAFSCTFVLQIKTAAGQYGS